MGQVAVISLSDQPSRELVHLCLQRQRVIDPRVEPGVVQGPGGGVDQVGEVSTRRRETTAEGIIDAHGRWRPLRRTHGTNLEPTTDTFGSAPDTRTRYPQGFYERCRSGSRAARPPMPADRACRDQVARQPAAFLARQPGPFTPTDPVPAVRPAPVMRQGTGRARTAAVEYAATADEPARCETPDVTRDIVVRTCRPGSQESMRFLMTGSSRLSRCVTRSLEGGARTRARRRHQRSGVNTRRHVRADRA